MDEYRKFLDIAGNVHLTYYVQAADKLGIPYKIIRKSLMARFEAGNRHWFIINTATPLTPCTGTTIAKRKSLTNLVLADAGIRVPKQVPLNSPIDALKFFNENKHIVIKPSQQLGGKGITILPETEDEVIEAYNLALEKSKAPGSNKVLGEEFLQGENYRFLVVGNEVIGMIRRKAAHVIGNGQNTIEELIQITNQKKREKLLKPIVIDNEVHRKLKEYSMTLESIPENGQEILLRYSCNLTAGGTTQECSEEVHEYYKELAVKAVKAIDCEFGGVDIIAKDISNPDECGINEINYNPGLRIHYEVDEGKVVEVAIPIMKYIQNKYLNS